jgi:hypothetical protein
MNSPRTLSVGYGQNQTAAQQRFTVCLRLILLKNSVSVEV